MLQKKVPLNQTYKEKSTFKDYPKIKFLKKGYESFCLNRTNWGKYGRSYDCAITLYNVNMKDKIICELGARDSLFSSYLTRSSKKVYASDNFEGWGDLGSLEYWDDLWKRSSFDPEKHVSNFQDMRSLSYDDNSMDVIVSFSAIEHIPDDGDILASREMGRVCKKGGVVVVGTDLCLNHTWHGGGYFYDKDSLFERIINNSGCELIGEYDFSFENSDKHFLNGLEYTSVIFFLRKV